MDHYRIIATAGHVDHGKSSLVKSLTSVDPDRLPEEKKRGITIELGFAQMTLPSPANPEDQHVIGIVDVPGHENFVKNMVSGVGGIDAAILVVAADDGWMPQTEEHLQILEYLGIQHVIIALTKSDKVTRDDIELATDFVREEIESSSIAQAEIIPLSSHDGSGIEALKNAVAGILDRLPPRYSGATARLSVDRAFSKKGVGTVVTGTLIDGPMQRDQTVTIVPGMIPSRIRSLQTYNCESDSSLPGTRTALNLAHAEIESGNRGKESGIHRGSIVVTGSSILTTNRIHGIICRSPRLESGQYQIKRPLKHNSVVRIHCGSGNFPARISLHNMRELLPGESCLVQFKLESSIFVKTGDRFIVRDWPQTATLAGGTVLDPHPSGYKLTDTRQLKLLEARKGDPTDQKAFICSQIQRDHYTRESELLVSLPPHAGPQESAISNLLTGKVIQKLGDQLVDTTWWEGFVTMAIEMVQGEHARRPERIGLRSNSLMSHLQRHGMPTEFQPVMRESLEANGFAYRGEFVHHNSHIIRLPDNLKAPAGKITNGLKNNPYHPGNLRELVVTESDQKALQFLIDTAEVIQVSDSVILSAGVFNDSVKKIQSYIQEHGPSTVSELKDAVGASRKIIVPLLEILDARGMTKRDGDKRSLPLR